MRRSIQERRERVSECLRKGMNETLIAKLLGLSRQTIVRDVAFLKTSSQDWLDGLAKNGFIFEYRLTLEKIKSNGVRLQELYDTTENHALKVIIIREIDRNAKKYLELLGETPTIHAYRQAVQREAIRNVP